MPAVLPTTAATPSGVLPKVYLQHQPRTVALVAMGPSVTEFIADTFTQEMTPAWTDEIWAINMAANGIWHDVCFWMDDLIAQHQFRPGLFDLLRQRGKPVITTDRQPDILPMSFDYPVQEIVKFGWEAFGRPYLNNGVAMAVAYALWKGVKLLRIYGADFTYPDRPYAETGRACLEAWIIFAHHKGMDVHVAPTCSLFDMHGSRGIYGYREQPEIVLDNGERHKFMRADEAMPAYRAEDSSGIKPDSGASPVVMVGGIPASQAGLVVR